MRVLYDISMLGFAHLYEQSRGGGFRVDLHVAEGLAASGECELLFCANHSIVAYHGCEGFLRSHASLKAIPLVGPRRSRTIGRLATTAHRWTRSLFGSNVLPSPVRRTAAFVDRRLHPAAHEAATADIFHSSIPLPPRANGLKPTRLLTVYDLAVIRFPHIYGAERGRRFAETLRSIRARDHVVTNSQYVRDELIAAGIAPGDRIHVVPLAADRTIFHPCDDPQRLGAIRRRYAIPDGPYLLGVNTPDPRKNVAPTIHAFARAARAMPDLSFVLTGFPGPEQEGIQEAIAQYPDLQKHIVLTGFVPDEDLAALYSGAVALVYASLYEGFGLPPLEAMLCGTPVIASDTSSIPEVVGDAGVLLAPADVDGLARAMIQFAGHAGMRRAFQARALARAARFSWKATVDTLLQAYRVALGNDVR